MQRLGNDRTTNASRVVTALPAEFPSTLTVEMSDANSIEERLDCCVGGRRESPILRLKLKPVIPS